MEHLLAALDDEIDGELRESGVRLNYGCHDRLRMAEAQWQNVTGGANYFVQVELLCDPLDKYGEVFFFVPSNIDDEGHVEFPEPRLEAIKYPVASGDALVLFKDDEIVNNTATTAYGSARDEYGCIASAGYAYCFATGLCQRWWEEPCASDMDSVGDDEDDHGCIASAG